MVYKGWDYYMVRSIPMISKSCYKSAPLYAYVKYKFACVTAGSNFHLFDIVIVKVNISCQMSLMLPCYPDRKTGGYKWCIPISSSLPMYLV